jgi:tetratricopeptide (TPR) repeat protein
LFCLEPNLLAHGHLATLDVPLTCAWWASLWFLRAWMLGSTRAGIGFCLTTAAAVLIKFTGLLLLPVGLLVGMVAARDAAQRGRLVVLLVACVGVTWCAAVVLYGTGSWSWGMPSGFIEALAGKWHHRQEGHFSYLAGRRSLSGFPEYNLVALAVKTPLPLLILAGVGCISVWRRWTAVDRAVLVLPPVVLLLVFSWGGVNIGVRHVLPVLPALLLCAAAAVWAAWKANRTRRLLTAGLLLVWMGSVLPVMPQWLSYFNLAAGGPAHGDRWLLDSNLDWGQDDTRLQEFLQDEARRGHHWIVHPDADVPCTGNLLVNVNELHALLRPTDAHYAWLRRHEPQGRVGGSWRTWRLTEDSFRRAVEQHPQDEARLVDYARVLDRAGQHRQAQALLAARRSTLAGDGIAVAVDLALDTEDLDAARRWLDRVPAARRRDAAWLFLQQRLSLQVQRQRAVTAQDSARVAKECGMLWAQAGEQQRALPLLQRAARLLPDDPEAQNAWMVVLARAGRYAEAAAVARTASMASVLREEGRLLERLARTDQQLDRVLSEGGRLDAGDLRDLALAEFEQQRADRAAAALTQLLRQDPNDRDALHRLGEIQVRSKLRILSERLTPRSLKARDAAASTGRRGS